MSKRHVIMRNDTLYTLGPVPKGVANPAKWRWMIWRDGIVAGFAKTKRDAQDRIDSGFYDRPGDSS